MSRPDLPTAARDDLIAAHRRRLRQLRAATRRTHRPLWPEVGRGLSLIVRHACRLTVYAVLLVAGLAFLVAYLDRGGPTP